MLSQIYTNDSGAIAKTYSNRQESRNLPSRNEIYLPEISSWLKRPGEMPSRNQVSRSIRQKIQ
jgi:hypothetical protein